MFPISAIISQLIRSQLVRMGLLGGAQVGWTYVREKWMKDDFLKYLVPVGDFIMLTWSAGDLKRNVSHIWDVIRKKKVGQALTSSVWGAISVIPLVWDAHFLAESLSNILPEKVSGFLLPQKTQKTVNTQEFFALENTAQNQFIQYSLLLQELETMKEAVEKNERYLSDDFEDFSLFDEEVVEDDAFLYHLFFE